MSARFSTGSPASPPTANYTSIRVSVPAARFLAFLITLGISGYLISMLSAAMVDVGRSIDGNNELKPFRATRALCCAVLCLCATSSAVAAPSSQTLAAFNRYMAVAHSRIESEQNSPATLLRIDSLSPATRADVEARLRRGEVIVEKVGDTPVQIPGGLIHDWVGTAFIPAATVPQVLSIVEDYDHLARYYSPDVMASRLISHRDDEFRIFMRLRKHKVTTVVLDTYYDVHYGRLDANHWYSDSVSTKVDEQGGGDHGFLWQLNSYWRFVQVNDGVIVQCEAISLTRDIPAGLGWMIRPFVTSIPRESLEFTMSATRKAVYGTGCPQPAQSAQR